jgi:hypothetical protein
VHSFRRVTDEGIAHVAGCTKLELLDLTNCRRVVHIDAIVAECPRLKTVALTECDEFSWTRFFSSVRMYNPPLLKLDLAACKTVNDESLLLLADANMDGFTHLSIHGCQLVTSLSLSGPDSPIRRILEARKKRYPSDGQKFYLMTCDCRGISPEALHQLRLDYANPESSEPQYLHLRCVKDLGGSAGRGCSCSNSVPFAT